VAASKQKLNRNAIEGPSIEKNRSDVPAWVDSLDFLLDDTGQLTSLQDMDRPNYLILEQIAGITIFSLPWHRLLLWEDNILLRGFVLCADIVSQSSKANPNYPCKDLHSQAISFVERRAVRTDVHIIQDLVSPMRRTFDEWLVQRPLGDGW